MSVKRAEARFFREYKEALEKTKEIPKNCLK